MEETRLLQTLTDKRLNREDELLQSFVRINLEVAGEAHEKPEKPDAGNQPAECAEKDEKPKQPAIIARDQPGALQPSSQQPTRRKWRKRRNDGPRHEELYTDKDRAAAVNMGTKDIKQSLKLKRKLDRTRNLQVPDEADPATFLALGKHEMNKGKLQIALNFMTKALELNPSDKSALVARSKCYILLGQPENGLKDAEAALAVDKNFMKAVYQKAESLYYLGNFEHSLMYFHRGLRQRPDHEGFKLGVHKAQKAIENAIGSKAFPGVVPAAITRTPSPNNSSSNRDVGWNRSAGSGSRDEKSPSASCGIRTPDGEGAATTKTDGIFASTPAKTASSQRTTPAPRPKTGKKSRLLRELGVDKDYLDNLANHPHIRCKFKGGDERVLDCIKEAVDYLNARQEFWRQQLPPNLK